mmetsp:Transcript_36344/g.88036  ORF Transcript_36344/g.88036 Transcript_36344/m.88036 type:complete len:440 (-) Transcript_36344:168-1487(-)
MSNRNNSAVEEDLNSNSDPAAQDLVSKAKFFHIRRDLKKAKKTYEAALRIQTKEFGEDDPTVASTLDAMGLVFLDEINHKEALEKFNRALAIRENKLGRHVDTAQTYEHIGMVFQEQKKRERAEEMFRKALDIKLEVLPKAHPELTQLYDQIAVSLNKRGKFAEATAVYKELLASTLQVHGEDHPDVVFAYNGISSLLAGKNRLNDALEILDKSLEICDRIQQRGHFNLDKTILGATLNNKARVKRDLGDYDAAAELFNQVLNIQRATIGEMHRLTADTYEELSRLYYKQEMLEDGINAFTKALEIHRKVLGDDHPKTKQLVQSHSEYSNLELNERAQALTKQGAEMAAEGDLEKAMELLQEALDIYKETVGVHPFTAIVYGSIAAIKLDQGLLDDAIAASAEALKILRRALGDDHAKTKARMEEHRVLLSLFLQVNRS